MLDVCPVLQYGSGWVLSLVNWQDGILPGGLPVGALEAGALDVGALCASAPDAPMTRLAPVSVTAARSRVKREEVIRECTPRERFGRQLPM